MFILSYCSTTDVSMVNQRSSVAGMEQLSIHKLTFAIGQQMQTDHSAELNLSF